MGTTPHEDATPLALHDHAARNLDYIRKAMENSGTFTAVSGWGEVAVGATALVAALVAARQADFAGWLTTWLVEAAIAVAVAGAAIARKARRTGVSLTGAPARKFIWSLSPPLIAGAILTAVLAQGGARGALPGVWLLLYGAGVVTGGAFSVTTVPLMGGALMATGALALVLPTSFGNSMMALGFGAEQIVFGLLIARRHGG